MTRTANSRAAVSRIDDDWVVGCGWFCQAVAVAERQRPEELLDDDVLAASAVVANCAMNRERQLTGVNSYARELGFDPVELLTAALADPKRGSTSVAWLDLCCGTGRAVIQAAERMVRAGLAGRTELVGVDLVSAFDPAPGITGLQLCRGQVTAWTPSRSFDLITCVHGLHYVGDKLGMLARAASWLTDTGQLVADLDLSNIRLDDGRPAGRRLTARLQAAGFRYNHRRHRISCIGRRDARLPYTYLGADDHAGANYTGQPAVHSLYRDDERCR
jgi:SAM-dependent methyltransferase